MASHVGLRPPAREGYCEPANRALGAFTLSRITATDNGLHSIAKGLEAFNALRLNPTDAYALKDAVLRTHHGIEAISKAQLFQLNPAFVLEDKTSIKSFIARYVEFVNRDNAFIVDGEHTVGLQQALIRLKQIGGARYPRRDFQTLQAAAAELETYRNGLQHFAVVAEFEPVARILGSLVPRFLDFIDALGEDEGVQISFSVLPLFQQLPDFGLVRFRERLDEFYSESSSVVELLRGQYDRLIREAIEYFHGRDFSDASLTVVVTDHGSVGPRPHRPELELTGIIDVAIDHSSTWGLPTSDAEPQFPIDRRELGSLAYYDGVLDVGQPSRTSADPGNGLCTVVGELSLQASIGLRTAASTVALPGADEYVGVLRNVEIGLQVSARYEAVALFDQYHFNIMELQELAGDLTLSLSAVPAGYAEGSRRHQISGAMQLPLDKRNAPFRLHAFVRPDGSLTDNHSLEWNLSGVSAMQF